MKIEILKENLKSGLDIVEKVISKNLSLPVLKNPRTFYPDNRRQ